MPLDAGTLEQAFVLLNQGLARRGQRAEIFLVGGAVMCLVHQARPSTKDVDAWFSEPQLVRDVAREVAEELKLDAGWLNDAAKGFLPEHPASETWREFSNLTISYADARTLLAMKCVAARTREDAADIRFLVNLLGLKTVEEILNVVLAFYPPERLPVRTHLLLEEMLGEGSA